MKTGKRKSILVAMALMANISAFTQIETPAVSAVFSATGSCGEMINWSLGSDGILTIEGEGMMYDWGNNYYNPSSKAPWDMYMHLITKVVIEDGVETIGNNAFRGAVSLTEVEIPKTVYGIGVGAFYDCKSLEKIDLPDNLDYIDEGAFIYCKSLKTISIPESMMAINKRTFDSCYALESVDLPSNLIMIDELAFNQCRSLAKIDIPKSVSVINRMAFGSCESLENITLPDGVTVLSTDVFSNCVSLKELILPESIETIESSAIWGCDNIKSISVPAKTTFIDKNAFINKCLESVIVDEENKYYKSVDGVLFDKDMTKLITYPVSKKAEEYTVPDSVKTICNLENKYMKTLVLPEGVEVIGYGALDSSPNLRELNIPASVIDIGNVCGNYFEKIEVSPDNKYYASVDGVLFNKEKTILISYPSLKKDTHYIIPDGVKKVDSGAFDPSEYSKKNQYLKQLEIPESVTEFYELRRLDYLFESLENVYYAGNKEEWDKLIGGNYIDGSTNIHFGKDDFDTATSERYYDETRGLRGDINNDGAVTVADILKLYNYLVGKSDGSEYSKYRFDVKTDGKIDISDAIRLKLALVDEIQLWDNTNIPIMDGSSSAIPLEAGLKSSMLGIEYSKAKELVKHHKTHESFKMLLNGENDLIFTVPISEEQKKMAEEAGRELVFTPVAKEGFVFIVNKDNPVDSLTQQQIRDIYSGKITNWSEVGGNDEEIIAYQRNSDSGSQNYMTEFMKGYDLMEAPKSHYLSSMAMIIDGVAFYDNSSRAIGYSVYSYAAQMYENMEDVKFIAIDGVEPSRETMADNSYPLLSNTYILYTDLASEDTKQFAKWAVSEEGQQCVLESGYVPLGDTEIPDELKAYTSLGTGKEKASDYVPSKKYSRYYLRDCTNIDFLKNKEFESVINNEISQAVADAKEKYGIEKIGTRGEIINGYMSVIIYDATSDYSSEVYNKLNVLNYNLIDGVKIEKFSDLFYKDIDFVSIVNENISQNITNGDMKSNWPSCIPYDVEMDFHCLTGEVDKFTMSEIIFDESSRYFNKSTAIGYTSYYTPDYMVTGEYFDISEVIDIDPDDIGYCDYEEWNAINIEKDGIITQQVEGSRFHTAEEVEMRQKAYDTLYEDAMKRQRDPENPSNIIITPSSSRFDVLYVNYGKIDGYCGPDMYDPQTGEKIYISDILGEDFKIYDDGYNYLLDINFGTNTVVIYTENDSFERSFDPNDVNSKYIKS